MMKDKLLKQASHEYSPKQRIVALIFLAPIFLFLLPYFFIRLGAGLDHWLVLPQSFPNLSTGSWMAADPARYVLCHVVHLQPIYHWERNARAADGDPEADYPAALHLLPQPDGAGHLRDVPGGGCPLSIPLAP